MRLPDEGCTANAFEIEGAGRGRRIRLRGLQEAQMGVKLCEPFVLISKLAEALKVKNIKQLPGCWEHAIDEQWFIAVNGHQVSSRTSGGVDVAPFNCYVEFNGWPAAYFGLDGGSMAAGAAANQESFIAALKAAIAKAKI